jgi:hypothetical protein
MSKGIPKRAGEVVDAICAECGIKSRLVPRSIALHKREAIAILTAIQTLKEMTSRKENG